MKIKILFFGVARDIAGTRELELELIAGCDVRDLRRILEESYPALNDNLAYAIAINEKFSSDDRLLLEGDVAAVLPPVSGG
jgi:molybdopterin converting factor subunit 1